MAATDCLKEGTCYAQLRDLEASAKAGVLGNFSLWPQMTQTNQRLSAPNVSCAFASDDGVCSGSLSDLNDMLYGAWYHANRDDIDYTPKNRWRGLNPNLEGAYQVASHYSKFSLAAREFEHTVLYNGSYVGGYPQVLGGRRDTASKMDEGHMAALANRVHAAISVGLLGYSDQGKKLVDSGFESVPLKHMGLACMVKWPALAAPQLGACASSGCAWLLFAARHSQEEAVPLGAQPPPRGLTRAASKVADLTV